MATDAPIIFRRLSVLWHNTAGAAMSGDWQNNIDYKLARLADEIDFIKNRLSIYLGNGKALTFFRDETPVYVNTNDNGCPINFINGGHYEDENLTVFHSYRKPGSIVLDIGSNLGIYSLRTAPLVKSGKIHAFEPIPTVRELLARSAYLNGFNGTITIHPFAVSDEDGSARLAIPDHHDGGASLSDITDQAVHHIEVQMRRLDSYFPDDFTCDLVKIDVEGHELHALRGMRRIQERSPDCVILFEKLQSHHGSEAEIFDYAKTLGRELYLISGTQIRNVDLDQFIDTQGYYVMGRREVAEAGGLDRDFINIYPADVNAVGAHISDLGLISNRSQAGNELVSYGPYWYLNKGSYRIFVDGDIEGAFTVALTERFGHAVANWKISTNRSEHTLSLATELQKFEIVLKSDSAGAKIALRKITIQRIG